MQGLDGSLKCSYFVLSPGCGAAFQKPPEMFHLEHAREGGATMETSETEVDLTCPHWLYQLLC